MARDGSIAETMDKIHMQESRPWPEATGLHYRDRDGSQGLIVGIR